MGAVGVLAFVRHVIFHRSDAIRLGWSVDHPEWQLEVGFANLAFGLPALFMATISPSYPAFFVLLAAYGLYLAQAAILHGIGYIKKRPQPLKKPILSVMATGIFAVMLGIFAGHALNQQ